MPYGPGTMQNNDIEALRAGIITLEGQRAQLGDMVVDLALAALRARLASLLRPGGLQLRQVTVLFADVVGSTAMASGLHAEDTLAVLNGAMQRMADIVEALQGRVLRFTGDGVKAAFGMDEAREDDAERAVRAGLAICRAGLEQAEAAQRLLGVADFAVRVGVHTGDVALGAGVDADNTAMGAAVNIAARMEQSAPPGALRISHDTWSQVRGLFEVESQPLLQVKGIAAPMQTYLVRGSLERSQASVERGLQGLATPMVGRDAELQRLLDTASQARKTGQLQALTMLGDAGLGKSRLLRELVAALATDLTAYRLLTLRSQPDGMLRPWGLLRALLTTQCGVADTDSRELAKRKVVDGLSPWFAERGEQKAQLIGQLSGLDFGDSPQVRGLDPKDLRDQALAALRGYLGALGNQGGALPVLLVEDLHWADDSSLDLLQHLQAHASELPMALVMTGRPALLERRPDWSTPGATLQLHPLAAAQSDDLSRALLQRIATVPPQLTALIIGRAEGNPYYMEELVRRLIDDGAIVTGDPHWTVRAERIDNLRLPGTLVGLLQARLDALPAGERQAVRHASVIGHVFWDDALQALDANAPQALPALQRAAFVRNQDASRFEGTAQRQFDHHLLHQVTYDTLLKAERRLGHAAAARWLTERTRGRGAEFLAMTGEHAERAGETTLAVDCFEQAGEEAKARFANTAAVAWTRRALALLGEAEPLRRFDLLARLERLADAAGNRAGQGDLHDEMANLLQRHPDEISQSRLLVARALLADRVGDHAGSEALARQALELAMRCEAAEPAAEAHYQLALVHLRRGEFDVGATLLVSAQQWASRIQAVTNRVTLEAQILALSGKMAIDLYRFDEARISLTAALARGEALGKVRLQGNALIGLTDLEALLGHWEVSRARAEHLHGLMLTHGLRSGVAWSAKALGNSTARLGHLQTAVGWYEEGLMHSRATGERRLEADILASLAALRLEQEQVDVAFALCEQARALHRVIQHPLGACLTESHAATCELAQGRPDVALATVNAVLERMPVGKATLDAASALGSHWLCQQVLAALGDPRAGPMLDELHANMLVSATARTGPDDRERLIQALPDYRGIAAARARRCEPSGTS